MRPFQIHLKEHWRYPQSFDSLLPWSEIISAHLEWWQNPTDNSTVLAYIKKQGRTHSAEMCALLWKILNWCHHYQKTIRARHIPGCLSVMAYLLFKSIQVQTTEWSLYLQVSKQICQKWFIPYVDLFTSCLNHKFSLYISPVRVLNA